jgi:hypothetical protein
MKNLPFLIFISLFPWAAASATAPDEPVQGDPVLEELLKKSLNLAESTRDVLSSQVVNIADYVDTFIGSERAEDEINGTHVRLRHANTVYQDGSTAHVFSTLFKLDLPRTNRRLSLVIESDNDKNAVPDSETSSAPVANNQAQPETAQNAGITSAIQYIMRVNQEWHVRALTGLAFRNDEFDPTAKLRIRRLFRGEQWNFRVTETLFWYRSIGSGESTRFDLERRLSPLFFFRASNQSTWHKDSKVFDLSQVFTLYHDLGDRQLLSYYTGVYGVDEPRAHITAYTAGVNFRQRIHKDWLYMDIAPLALFPVTNDFEFTPSITVSLEMLIGNGN